jgi:hypothetical protein
MRVVVVSGMSEANSSSCSLGLEATNAVESWHLSMSNVSGVAAGDGVSVVGGPLELVVEA